MEKLSYVQEYFMLALNEKGNIPISKGASIAACLVISEITELESRGYVIWDEDNKISITKPSDESLTYLIPMYETIAYFNNPEDVLRIVDMYSSNIRLPGNYRKSIKELLLPIGKSLEENAYVDKITVKGLFREKTKYIPKPEIVINCVDKIRNCVMENNAIDEDTLSLIVLLDKSEILHNFFNASEITHIKERIRSKQENNKDTPVDKMLDHVEGVTKMLSALNWG